jgi:2,4-dienoyl-CoA reductase-like NADH-dependent reductase (Old Yellow Enzyme family)
MSSYLFKPLLIRETELKNRIVMSPMCQYSALDGLVNDWHFVHYGSRAVGGAALILSEATAVSPEGRISPYDLGIWKEEHVEGWKRINRFIHAQGSLAGIQLAHAGRKGSTGCAWKEGDRFLSPAEGGWQTMAPSAIPFNEADPAPAAMDRESIDWVVNEFAEGAHRAVNAGFDVAEIHAAHGYLLHQFLSPLSNHRTDKYGGSFENRIRFLLEVVEAVRAAWPVGKPLFVRISATDWVSGGWNLVEAARLAGLLKQMGVDLIDVSSGGLVPNAKIQVSVGYQVPFASKIRQETGILTGAVGLITQPEQAETLITNGLADVIIIGRELLRNPYFALHAAPALHHDVEWPVQYQRAKNR